MPFRTDDDGNEVVTFAFRPVADRRTVMSMDVAIVGVGLHPFGRFGETTGIEMGAVAIRNALADAGVSWDDIQFAFARQLRDRQPRRGRRAAGPHRHPVHRRVQRLRDRGERARAGRADHPPRRARPRHRGGHGQAPAGRVRCRPAALRVPVVVRRGRAVRHHQVLRHEDQQVHDRPRHLVVDAGEGGGEELPQRLAQPERVPAQAAVGGRDPQLDDAQLPADAVHVLQPRRRRGGGRAVQGRERPQVHRHADLPARHRGAHPSARCVRGAQPVAADRADGGSDGRRVTRRVRDGRASGPRTSTSSSCRTPTPAPR